MLYESCTYVLNKNIYRIILTQLHVHFRHKMEMIEKLHTIEVTRKCKAYKKISQMQMQTKHVKGRRKKITFSNPEQPRMLPQTNSTTPHNPELPQHLAL